jgi:hypothetical protein
LKRNPAKSSCSPRRGNRPSSCITSPADRVVLLVAELRAEELVELLDPREREHDVAAVFLRLDRRGLFLVVLVVDLADDLLQHVLDSRDPGDAAVFVDDDGHVVAALAKLGEQRVQPLALGNEHGGTQAALDVERLAARVFDEMLQHVLRENDADDLVAVVADHRKARVVRLDDRLEQLVGRVVLAEHHHLAARHMMSRTCVFETSSTPSSIASSSGASTPRSRNSARNSAIPASS